MDEPWPIHTLVFDLDDTLYDERTFVSSGLAAVDAWLVKQHGVRGFQLEAQRLFDEGVRGRVFDEALDRLGVRATNGLVADMVAIYRRHEPSLQLLPEAHDVLMWARGEDLKLGLVTDGIATVQRKKIAALGLTRYLDCVVVSDEMGGRAYWKPHWAPFLRVMGEIHGEPDGFVYVADNPRKDFIAPRAIGWRTVRIRRPATEHGAYEAAPDERAELDLATLAALPSMLRARHST